MSGNPLDPKNLYPLDVLIIADVGRIRRKPNPWRTCNIQLHHEHFYKGVLVMEISVLSANTEEGKRVKLNNDRRRVAIIGQSIDAEGKAVFMERGRGATNRANVTAGLNFEIVSVDKTHWCDGLAIEHVEKLTAGGKVGRQTAKRVLKDARIQVVKEILRLIDDDDNSQKDWTKLNWKAVDAYIDGFQHLLGPNSASTLDSISATNLGIPAARSSRPVATQYVKPVATQYVKPVATTDSQVVTSKQHDNRFKSQFTGDDDGKQVPSTLEPIDPLPDFDANMMGLSNVKEAELAKTLWEKLMYPVRLSEAEDNKRTFVNLMNKAYPHALFTPRIFDACWRRGNNVRTYTFLEEVPEFIDWWRIAHVRPPAKKSPSVLKPLRQQANTKPLDPGFTGLCYWLVSQAKVPPKASSEGRRHVGVPRKTSSGGHLHVKVPPKTSSDGHHHVKPVKQQAKSKPLYPGLIGFHKWLRAQTTVPPRPSFKGHQHDKALDPPDIPAHDDVHVEDITPENAHSGIDWDELDAMEALL